MTNLKPARNAVPSTASDDVVKLPTDRASLVKFSQAENTQKAYKKAWRQWCEHCEAQDIDPENASGDDVAGFLLQQAGRVSVSTLTLTLSGINDFYRRRDMPSPTHKQIVRDALAAVRVQYGGGTRQVKAITAEQLELMLRECSQTRHGRRDACLLSLGFSAALRRSELVNLTVDCLVPRPDHQTTHCFLRIKRSKTDKFGKGQQIPLVNGSRITPITHLVNWLDISGIESGLILRALSGARCKLDAGEVARVVKRYAARLGLDPPEYSGHSLRAGFVTAAAANGARLEKIMDITRHRSTSTVLRYIRDENAFNDHAGESFL